MLRLLLGWVSLVFHRSGFFVHVAAEADISLEQVENLTRGMTLDIARDGDEIKILIYSLNGETIGVDEGRLVSLPLRGEYSITRMEMGSFDGRLMSLSMASEKPLLPSAFELDQNYPNPFNPETSIHFALPTMARVQLVVYNVLGQQVAVLVDGEYPAGDHRVTWNGTDRNGESVASGVYLYRLSTDAENLTRKMMLLK